MGNQKLLCAPTMFQPWLNQTEIDLSIQKLKLVERETVLIKAIRDLNYELFEVKNKLSGLDWQNEFATSCHNLNLLRRR